MKKITKNIIFICGIYALTQLPGHAVFAKEIVDKQSIESSISSNSSIIKNNLGSNIEKDNNSKTTYIESQEINTNLKTESKNSENVITKENVPVKKSWKVTFNEPVELNKLKDKIKLKDTSSGKTLPIDMTMDSTEQVVTISSLVTLNPESNYSLSISNGIVSKFGKQLSNPTIVKFKTAPVISYVDNISKIINQGDTFNLPTLVTAHMSNGSTSSVSVSWNKSLDNTNAPGHYTFTGSIADYGNITLNLTINPFKPVTTISNGKRVQSSTGVKLYNYLMNYKNRNDVYSRAVSVHASELPNDDPYRNNCAFYQSEALRSIGINIPKNISNTRSLTNVLLNMGWKKSEDLSILLPGDICFTIAYDSSGPTHAYTFMGWVDPKHFNYGYVCDNQGNEYGNDAYHIRNINFSTPIKDKISYFMYLS
jgi:hypothetical protein